MIETEDFEFEYKDIGEGPILVLLHGFGGSHRQWDAVADALSKSYRVIVPNLSRLFINTKLATFSEQVQCIQEFITKVSEAKPVHIAAASYGGALSWGVAIQAPKLVASLTLLSPMPPNPLLRFRSQFLRHVLAVGRWPSALWLYLKLPIGRRGLSKLSDMFQVPWLERKKLYKDKSPPSDRQLKVLVLFINKFSKLIMNEDWSYWESRLSFITQPVCLIWGENDLLYFEEEPSRFLRLFNNGQLHHLEQTGHFSMAENPLPVVYILDQFLTRFKKAA
jgi:pimeloyl-ACP methyl ester carboxylesterase